MEIFRFVVAVGVLVVLVVLAVLLVAGGGGGGGVSPPLLSSSPSIPPTIHASLFYTRPRPGMLFIHLKRQPLSGAERSIQQKRRRGRTAADTSTAKGAASRQGASSVVITAVGLTNIWLHGFGLFFLDLFRSVVLVISFYSVVVLGSLTTLFGCLLYTIHDYLDNKNASITRHMHW